MTYSTNYPAYLLALGLGVLAHVAHAADAGASVRAFATDTPAGFEFTDHSASGPSSGTAVVRSVTSVAGNASSSAQVAVDPLSGTVREKLNGEVAASKFIIGRAAGATSVAFMRGGIDLVGPALPGLATFTAVLEGSYDISTPSPFDYPSINNSVALDYMFQVGDSPAFNNTSKLYYFCCSPGTFSIPFTWTQMVSAGDFILFDFYLRADLLTVAGLAQFDASHTFKVTGVDLPEGYSFTSDSDGFLSKSGATPPVSSVPEPESSLLLALGLILMAATRWRTLTGAGLSITRLRNTANAWTPTAATYSAGSST